MTMAWLRRLSAMVDTRARSSDPHAVHFNAFGTTFSPHPLATTVPCSLPELFPNMPVFVDILGQQAAAHVSDIHATSSVIDAFPLFRVSSRLRSAIREACSLCLVRAWNPGLSMDSELTLHGFRADSPPMMHVLLNQKQSFHVSSKFYSTAMCHTRCRLCIAFLIFDWVRVHHSVARVSPGLSVLFFLTF